MNQVDQNVGSRPSVEGDAKTHEHVVHAAEPGTDGTRVQQEHAHAPGPPRHPGWRWADETQHNGPHL